MTPDISQEKAFIYIRYPRQTPEGAKAALKANGFRWSRHSMCWRREDTPRAMKAALWIITL